MFDYSKYKLLILSLGINIIVLLIALIFSINQITRFFDNWFIIAIITTSILTLRLLYERGAYDSINYSMHRVGFKFNYQKAEALNNNDKKKFKDINDYIEYRKTKKTPYTIYLLLGSLIGLLFSVCFSLF